jgi:hypothetical protein
MRRKSSGARLAAVLVVAATAVIGSSAASASGAGSHSAKPAAASLGKQLCGKSGPFVYLVWGKIASSTLPDRECYDGGPGTIKVPAKAANLDEIIAVVDNQSGHRIWLSGQTTRNTSFNFCYDRGFDFTLGPPADGGSGPENLLVTGISEGKSTADCTGVPKGSIDTTEPEGTVPHVAPNCNKGDIQGGHVFVTTDVGDAEASFTNFQCFDDSVKTNTKGVEGDVSSVANGTGHQVFVAGSGFSICVSNNHVIDPIAAKYQGHITSVRVAKATKNC